MVRSKTDDTTKMKDWKRQRQNGDVWIHGARQHAQYIVEIWNEGTWLPVGYARHPSYHYDAEKHIQGYQRITSGLQSESSLCGIYRDEHANTLPLYQQGYEEASAYEQPRLTSRYLEKKFPCHAGHITHEFAEGRYAGRADYDLHHGEMWVSSDTDQHPRIPVNPYVL